MSIKVAVLGAKGRMGSQTVQSIIDAPDLELSAALDLGDSLDQLVSTGTQVIVDFTHPNSVMGNLEFAINHHFLVKKKPFIGDCQVFMNGNPASAVY